jgi:hypothetical protein
MFFYAAHGILTITSISYKVLSFQKQLTINYLVSGNVMVIIAIICKKSR